MLKNAKLKLIAAVLAAALPALLPGKVGFAAVSSAEDTSGQAPLPPDQRSAAAPSDPAAAPAPAPAPAESKARRTSPQPPKPQGFDEVDKRFRAPLGFYQDRTDNTIKNLKDNGQDGDYAVIAGTIVQELGDDCYVLADEAGDKIEICRLPSTQPEDLAIVNGHHYMLWTQIDKKFFSLSLDVLLFADTEH